MSENTHIMDDVLNERVYELLDHYSPYELLTGLHHNVKENFDGPEYVRIEKVLAGAMVDIVTVFAEESEMGMTKGELAEKKTKEAGIETYDMALPQPWLDEVTNWETNRTGRERSHAYYVLLGGTVWAYTDSIFGEPFFLSTEAEDIFKLYTEANG